MPYELLDDDVPSTGLHNKESTAAKALRNVARLGARAVETVAGLPGNLESLGRSAVNFAGRNTVGVEPLSPQSILPTSENIRELGRYPGDEEYLEPKGGIEEFSDEFTKDVIPFLLSGTGPLASTAIAGGANLAKLATEKITGSETAGDVVKLGTMLASSLFSNGKGGLKKLQDSFYEQSRELLPKKASTSAQPFTKTLDKIEKSLNTGTITPSKQSIAQVVSDLKGKIRRSGQIPVNELLQFKIDINELFGDKRGLTNIQKLAPALNGGIKDAIQEYGKTNVPFIKAFNSAEDVFKGLNQATAITQFLKDNVNPKNMAYAAGSALLGLKDPTAIAKGVGAAYTAREFLKGAESIARSKEVRKYYFDVIKSAARKDATALLNNVAKLNSAMKKEGLSGPESPESGRYELLE